MRIDALLKSLCLAKTRSQAHRGCEVGCIALNGRKAKPSAEVRSGDIIEIRYPRKLMAVEILTVPERQVPRGECGQYYRVIRENAIETEGEGGYDV